MMIIESSKKLLEPICWIGLHVFTQNVGNFDTGSGMSRSRKFWLTNRIKYPFFIFFILLWFIYFFISEFADCNQNRVSNLAMQSKTLPHSAHLAQNIPISQFNITFFI